jgi:hypothetical protein
MANQKSVQNFREKTVKDFQNFLHFDKLENLIINFNEKTFLKFKVNSIDNQNSFEVEISDNLYFDKEIDKLNFHISILPIYTLYGEQFTLNKIELFSPHFFSIRKFLSDNMNVLNFNSSKFKNYFESVSKNMGIVKDKKMKNKLKNIRIPINVQN